jgi:hypothetical protein
MLKAAAPVLWTGECRCTVQKRSVVLFRSSCRQSQQIPTLPDCSAFETIVSARPGPAAAADAGRFDPALSTPSP